MGEAEPSADIGTTRKRRWAWAGGILAAVVTAVLTALATGLVDRVINPVPPEETEAYQEYQAQVREFCDTFPLPPPRLDGQIAPGRVLVFSRGELTSGYSSVADAYAAALDPLFDIEPHPALVDEFEQAKAQYQAELDALADIKDAIAALGPQPAWEEWYAAGSSAVEQGLSSRTTRAFSALAGEECPISVGADDLPPPEDPPACLPNASIALAPRSGPSGTGLTVRGTGFPPDTEIQIWARGPEGAARTDRDGNFEVSFIFETSFDGPVEIMARSLGESCTRRAQFDVTN